MRHYRYGLEWAIFGAVTATAALVTLAAALLSRRRVKYYDSRTPVGGWLAARRRPPVGERGPEAGDGGEPEHDRERKHQRACGPGRISDPRRVLGKHDSVDFGGGQQPQQAPHEAIDDCPGLAHSLMMTDGAPLAASTRFVRCQKLCFSRDTSPRVLPARRERWPGV